MTVKTRTVENLHTYDTQGYIRNHEFFAEIENPPKHKSAKGSTEKKTPKFPAAKFQCFIVS